MHCVDEPSLLLRLTRIYIMMPSIQHFADIRPVKLVSKPTVPMSYSHTRYHCQLYASVFFSSNSLRFFHQ